MLRPARVFPVLLLAALIAAPIAASAQAVTIGGDVETPFPVDVAALKALPRTTVEVNDHGQAHTYEGVLVSVLLARAGVPLGDQLRGRALSAYVLVTARDKYQVVFSIGEMDPALSKRTIILADTVDGQPLTNEQGPIRLVVSDDTRPARSVRMVSGLRVVRVTE